MPSSDRSRELIHKYFEDLASPSEVVELEVLLSTDPEVAGAFAEAARLDGMLKCHFRKQQKIDQVAALLQACEPRSQSGSGLADPTIAAAVGPGAPCEPPRLTGSTFVRRYSEPTRPRRSPIARSLAAAARRWRWIAASLLLATAAASVWFLSSAGEDSYRLISGRVTVAGRDVVDVPESAVFEVSGKDGVVIQFARGTRIELTPATRAALRRADGGFIMQLNSGGGEFMVPRDQRSFRIETDLGIVTGADCRFSLEIVTGLPGPAATTQRIPMPRLVVVVARGSVTVERAGVSTTLSAGEQQAFL
jgi:hypothetical protein